MLAGALVFAAPAPSSAQCAMCRTALTNSAEGRSIGEQFNRAILLMIAAPYLVMGTVGAVVFRRPLSAAWRARRQKRAAFADPAAGR